METSRVLLARRGAVPAAMALGPCCTTGTAAAAAAAAKGGTAAAGVGSRSWRRGFSLLARDDTKKGKKRERVVILGSGWAGYGLARALDPARFERVVVSPRSYFVFTPLLASTSVGTLEFRAVLEPVRRIPGVVFHQGWADGVDFARKVVRVEANTWDDDVAARAQPPPPPAAGAGAGARETAPARSKGDMVEVPYDRLVVAVGAYSQTFGIEGVREHAHLLRDVGDARRIRLRVLSLFEQCASASPAVTDERRRELLHFAVVGGGPTGVEFAAELHDLVHDDLARIYPSLLPFVQITVYDIAPQVLPMFDRQLAGYAVERFRRQGIRVRTEHHLTRIRADPDTGGLRLRVREFGDEEAPVGMVVWSTGLMQNPLLGRLMNQELRLPRVGSASPGTESKEEEESGGSYRLAKDPKTGGIVTDPFLRARVAPTSPSSSSSDSSDTTDKMETLPDVFVIGDCAVMENQRRLPKTAQVASQQAGYLARRLNAGDVDGGPDSKAKPFRFRNWGTMTYLGNWKAIHQSDADELKGWSAWVLWRSAYVTYSISVRNKIMVPVYWVMTWLFGRDISRF